jgi:hypothetical protein
MERSIPVAEDRCCVERSATGWDFAVFASGGRALERPAPVLTTEEKYGGVMKKTIKKLTLAKETLRNLNEEQIADVVGGVVSKRYSDCGSCGIACTVIDCGA